MSHGVHEVQHQAEHEIEHQQGHGGHGGASASFNKRVALLIAVLALFLSLSETMGKSSQTSALNEQIEASNLWNFFQAKNIRRTLTIVASEQGKLTLAGASDAQKAAVQKQIDDWTKTAARYRSEPETHEGTTELMERAKEQEHKRDHSLARYHQFEFASAAFQIGIVLASAAVITSMALLAYVGIGLGVLGLGFMALGLWAPHAVHLM
jgi:hypothetical protein